jgi:hypothetical protein
LLAKEDFNSSDFARRGGRVVNAWFNIDKTPSLHPVGILDLGPAATI